MQRKLKEDNMEETIFWVGAATFLLGVMVGIFLIQVL
jgi:hypothetical protein